MLVTVSSPWEVRKLLAKGRKLVNYDFPAFLSRALNQEEIQVEKSMLLRRRAIIARGVSKLDIRMENQQLYFKGQKVKDLVLTSEEENPLRLPRNQNWLQNSISCLVFNTRSLLNLDRRRMFAVAAETSAYDIIALIETWLTADISDSELFLQNYQLYRSERNANLKSKYGGVMIGVRNNITSFPIDVTNLNDKLTSAFAGSLRTVNDEKVLIWCLYNPPSIWSHPYIIRSRLESC